MADVNQAANLAEYQVEGLLHLATMSFVLTLAYLGLDKVGDEGRAHLEGDLKKKELAIVKALSAEGLLGGRHDDDVNEFHDFVGDRSTRKAICMLLALAKNLRHDLYRGWFGAIKQWLHSAELFLAFRCYLNHWDIAVIKVWSFVSGIIFFGLIYATTFRIPVHEYVLIACFIVDGMIVLFIIVAARRMATARTRLEKKYTRWFARYRTWIERIKTTRFTNAVAMAAHPIAPGAATRISDR